MAHFEFPGLHVAGSPTFASATGTTCVDTEGVAYTDLAMGFGVRLFGHPADGAYSIHQVAARIGHAAPGLGDLYSNELREHALATLCEETAAAWSGVEAGSDLRASIWHTGSEAVETAIKTALLATGRPRVIAFTGSYHGTFGLAMAATSHPAFRAPFESMLTDAVEFVPWGDVPAIDEDVACVIVEPIQGRAGVRIPPDAFLRDLRTACTQAGALLVLDEVLTGSGRTGSMLAGGWATPDIVALGKALGGGIPAAATVTTAQVANTAWGGITGEAIHTSTWVGEPIAAAGIIDGAIRRATSVHERELEATAWDQTLTEIADHTGWMLRGQGLLWALDLGVPGAGWELAQRLLHEHHMIVVPSGYDGRSVTLLPATRDGEVVRATFATACAALT
jgi:acetylornithine/succinyldiaminopimelate/putrescine aminotransferase